MNRYFGGNIYNSLHRCKIKELRETLFKATTRVQIKNNKHLDLYTGTSEHGRRKKIEKN